MTITVRRLEISESTDNTPEVPAIDPDLRGFGVITKTQVPVQISTNNTIDDKIVVTVNGRPF